MGVTLTYPESHRLESAPDKTESVTREYRVTAPHAILGVKPGEVAELTLSADHEKRLLDCKALEVVPQYRKTKEVFPRKDRPEKAVTTESEKE